MTKVAHIAPLLAGGAMCVAVGILLLKIKGLEERLKAAIDAPPAKASPAVKTLPVAAVASVAPSTAVVQTRPTQGKVQPAKHKHTVGLLPTAAVGRGQEAAGPPVFPMEQIGTVLSPFPHRAGTPRQGYRPLRWLILSRQRWARAF